MGLVRKSNVCLVIIPCAMVLAVLSSATAGEFAPLAAATGYGPSAALMPPPYTVVPSQAPLPPPMGSMFFPQNDYLVKMAYGRTFGTSTELDYATLEFSKKVAQYPILTYLGPAAGEVQMAFLASYVFYTPGDIEKIKRLNFRDGYELAWLPKGRFTFSVGPMGMNPYVESGAGMSYVSETYRNSGSRFNWSLLGGFGLQKCMPGAAVVSVGVQWRHLSNGNMWGVGDELHNSNSGTDMIQGLATILHRF